MGNATKTVNVGRLLDKIHVAMEAFSISDVNPNYDPENPDDNDLTLTGEFKAIIKEFAPGKFQTIFRGDAEDGEVSIYFRNKRVPGNLSINNKGKVKATGEEFEADFSSNVTTLFIATLFGAKEVGENISPQLLSAATYARCLMEGTCHSSTKNKLNKDNLYVIKALRFVDDMRLLAEKEDHWYNRTTPKDVDKVLNKFKPLIFGVSAILQKNILAKQMLVELFETPTGKNLFWNLKENHSDLYGCEHHYESPNSVVLLCDDDETESGGSVETCTILGAVTMSRGGAYCRTRW